MNLTKLNRRAPRETKVVEHDAPVIFSLEPGEIEHLSSKVKGERHTLFTPLHVIRKFQHVYAAGLVTVVDMDTVLTKHRQIAPVKHVKAKEEPIEIPPIVQPLLDLMKEYKGPIHKKTLDSLMKGQCPAKELQRLYSLLVKENKIKHVQPFHYQAVTA